MKAPKHTEARIYWHKEGSRAFVLVGYCPDNLEYFLALYEWARERFPKLKRKDCNCGKIIKSGSIQGYTFLSFPVSGEMRDIPNFDNFTSSIDFNF